jgi:hypothetical protein
MPEHHGLAGFLLSVFHYSLSLRAVIASETKQSEATLFVIHYSLFFIQWFEKLEGVCHAERSRSGGGIAGRHDEATGLQRFEEFEMFRV